jgi:hypothetical protein
MPQKKVKTPLDQEEWLRWLGDTIDQKKPVTKEEDIPCTD